MKRKTIAVCITGYNWENETRIVDGISERCKELDINLLVFSSLLRKPDINSDRVLADDVVNGETEIFNLINYEILDGMIVLGNTFLNDGVLTTICSRAKAKGIPVVNAADPAHTLSYNVLLSDKIAMEFAVRHLIEKHGVRKINFIGGFKGNLETEERLSAYKRVLAEFDIPFEEERVAYGEFWKKAADCTAKFMESEQKPEAIVCASDTMAFFCMDYLKEHGYRIPEDILVTGFDGIADSETYSPSLTTVRHAVSRLGRTAVDMLEDIWAGREVSETSHVESELIIRQSCGCRTKDKDILASFAEQVEYKTRTLEFNTDIIEMNTLFAGAKTSAQLYDDSRWGADYFRLKSLKICICSNIERELNASNDGQYVGLSDTMLCMLDSSGNTPVGSEFPTSRLIPELELNGEKAMFMCFSPLYFKNSFMGYLAYEPTDLGLVGDQFITWALNISNNAGSFYLKNQLEYVVSKLENLYVRDPLTSLYNRRGMSRFGEELIKAAIKKRRRITVFSIDIDNLKPINDNYGHIAGDNAICQAATAISTAMPLGSVCCRTGGDEFCVITSGIKEGTEDRYIKSIDALLTEYNEKSGLPYTVVCSSGFNSAESVEFESMENMITLADIEMYKVKAARKVIRK